MKNPEMYIDVTAIVRKEGIVNSKTEFQLHMNEHKQSSFIDFKMEKWVKRTLRDDVLDGHCCCHNAFDHVDRL